MTASDCSTCDRLCWATRYVRPWDLGPEVCDWLSCDCDCDVERPATCRGIPAEVSMFCVMSKSSLPNRRLIVPSDQRIILLFDWRCLIVGHELGSIRNCPGKTYITAIGVFNPPPSHGIFNFQFDGHAFLSYTLCLHGFFFFRSKICVGMEWFRIHFYKIRHANYPILDNEFERRPLELKVRCREQTHIPIRTFWNRKVGEGNISLLNYLTRIWCNFVLLVFKCLPMFPFWSRQSVWLKSRGCGRNSSTSVANLVKAP